MCRLVITGCELRGRRARDGYVKKKIISELGVIRIGQKVNVS